MSMKRKKEGKRLHRHPKQTNPRLEPALETTGEYVRHQGWNTGMLAVFCLCHSTKSKLFKGPSQGLLCSTHQRSFCKRTVSSSFTLTLSPHAPLSGLWTHCLMLSNCSSSNIWEFEVHHSTLGIKQEKCDWQLCSKDFPRLWWAALLDSSLVSQLCCNKGSPNLHLLFWCPRVGGGSESIAAGTRISVSLFHRLHLIPVWRTSLFLLHIGGLTLEWEGALWDSLQQSLHSQPYELPWQVPTASLTLEPSQGSTKKTICFFCQSVSTEERKGMPQMSRGKNRSGKCRNQPWLPQVWTKYEYASEKCPPVLKTRVEKNCQEEQAGTGPWTLLYMGTRRDTTFSCWRLSSVPPKSSF